jgi:hypothetical protein
LSLRCKRHHQCQTEQKNNSYHGSVPFKEMVNGWRRSSSPYGFCK